MLRGIRKIGSDGSDIFFIDELTEEIKHEIRCRLVEICYGRANLDSSLKEYSYKATVKEFIKRYKNGSEVYKTRNKGMIGELLFHIVFGLDKKYKPISAFFNLEERSFKKGFDSGYYSSETNKLWIAEVKAGEKQEKQKSVSTTMVRLLNTAKKDLENRLTSENNSLWINAINHARNAMFANDNNEKKAVLSLLGQYSNDAAEGIYISKDKNVILVGVVFHPINKEEIACKKIERKNKQIKEEGIFASLITIAIQESTYKEMYQFLESEAKDD